ncbi:MAG TPA: polysaccharide biosynthesis/export family protein [Polyangiaceae bacterium]|nr:polysaccharide biosynthesis/export family protein [Polyangiaceae bacterium]
MRRSVVVLLIALTACSGGGPPSNLPPAVPSTKLGPSDLFEVNIVGEKDLPKEYRVQPDCSIDFPYIDRVQNVCGLEPQELVDKLRATLKEKQILTNPQVTLVVKQYASKKVSVIGQVNKPGSVSWTDGLRLFDVISQSGGFTSIADSKHVVLVRQISGGKTVTVTVNVDGIGDGTQPDVPVQAGDTIKVDSRVF